ncbi:MAG: Ig-like domain repeat protein [Acidobacteriota bacterium]|nr:Ig-like domain repeat protein [Acidobacteriota bacterium]
MRKTIANLLLVLGILIATATVARAQIYTNVWISSDTNPANAGQPINLTGQVIAPCPGTITFLDGSTVLGTATLNTGYAYLQVSTLAPGTHSITASYSGGWLCYARVSDPLSQVINGAAATITSLSLPQGPPQVGLTITGTNFGATKGNSTVTINGVNATVIPGGWSATSIDVQVPSTTSGNVVVTVNSVGSNAVAFTVTSGFGCS